MPQKETTSDQFSKKKERILEDLSVPRTEYTDASPKGSVDEEIRDLIEELNTNNDFVTTSSCAGRVSVFVEGESSVKGGAGAQWLFVSHSAVASERPTGKHDYLKLFGMALDHGVPNSPETAVRYIHFKFEPMILHVLARSMDAAQTILVAALAAGFRESGAVNLLSAAPMVAVRSQGLALDCIIGFTKGGINKAIVDQSHLAMLVDIANERFRANELRIGKFREGLMTSQALTEVNWESAGVRRDRKRAEGLKRKDEMQFDQASKGVFDQIEKEINLVDFLYKDENGATS